MRLEIAWRTLLVLGQASWRKISGGNTKALRWGMFFLTRGSGFLVFMMLHPNRAALIGAIYAWFRPIDDLIDGEVKIDPDDLRDLIAQKAILMDRLKQGDICLAEVEGNDRLLPYILSLSRRLGIEGKLSVSFR